MQVFYFILRRV